MFRLIVFAATVVLCCYHNIQKMKGHNASKLLVACLYSVLYRCHLPIISTSISSVSVNVVAIVVILVKAGCRYYPVSFLLFH